MKHFLRSHINTIIAVTFTAALMAVVWRVCPVKFETGDDRSMLALVAGAISGQPYPFIPFCNILWGLYLTSLYKLTGTVTWYTVSFICLIVISLSVVCAACIGIFYNKNTPIIGERHRASSVCAGIGVFCALYFTLLCYYSVVFEFTTAAAMCGMAAVLLIPTCKSATGRQKYPAYILMCLLLLCADIIRPQIGYLTTLAFLMFWLLICADRKKRDKALPLTVLCIQAVTFIIDKFYPRPENYAEYIRFNAARSGWIDYPHASFADNPTLYESAGWSANLVNLVEEWFFMDKNITSETFERLSGSGVLSGNIFDVQNIYNAVSDMSDLGLPVLFFWMTALIITVVTILRLVFKKKLKTALLYAAFPLTCCFITYYFASQGRIVSRVLFSLFFLFITPPILFSLNECKIRPKHYMLIAAAGAVFCVGCCVAPYGMLRVAYDTSNAPEVSRAYAVRSAVEDYALRNNGNIYITDSTLIETGDPFKVYGEQKPLNLLLWGGWDIHSPAFYARLQALGRDELNSDDFLDDNVYFMTAERPNRLLIDYMQEKFPGSYPEVTDTGEGFVVYKFRV